MVLKISERYKIQIIQAYAPMSTHSDEERESFYEHLKETYEKGRDCFYKFIIGDFNDKVGNAKKVIQLLANMEETKEMTEVRDWCSLQNAWKNLLWIRFSRSTQVANGLEGVLTLKWKTR